MAADALHVCPMASGSGFANHVIIIFYNGMKSSGDDAHACCQPLLTASQGI